MRVEALTRSMGSLVKTLSNDTVFKIYSIIMLLLAFSVLMPNTIFINPGIGLDPSWFIALNLIKTKNLVFGKDVIFNYGPLGYLFTRLPIGVGRFHYVLWDCFIIFNLAFVFFYVFKKLKSFKSIIAAVVSVAFMSPLATYWPLEYTLFLIFMFMLFYYTDSGSIFALIMASLMSITIFYFKFNLGLASLFLMLVFFLYLFLYPKWQSRTFIFTYAIIFALLLIISSLILNTNLIGYVQGGIHLANAYSDAVYLTTWHNRYGVEYLIMALIILLSFAAVFLLRFKEIMRDKTVLLRFVFTGLFLFLLYKHGFVRADEHIFGFFSFVSAGIGLLCLFVPESINNYISKVLIISLVFSFYAFSKEGIIEVIPNRIFNLGSYLSALADTKQFEINNPQLEKSRLPRNILQVIDHKSIDVVPWEFSYIYVNDLNYDPRPTIQSITAFDSYLDNKNYEKYMSETAPEFILFSVNSIDNRHPFFDESKTTLAILARYELISHVDDNLLLKKLKHPREITEKASDKRVAKLGQFITLEETNDLQYMRANIEYSLLGSIIRILFQPPRLNVTIKFDDGEERTYRAVKPMVNGEVMINKFVESTDEANSFFKHEGKKSRNVEKIKFDSPQKWGFKKNFAHQIKYVELERDSQYVN
jgi:hypothetical protein